MDQSQNEQLRSSLQNLVKIDSQLKQPSQNLRWRITGLRSKAQNLQRAFFRIGVYLGVLTKTRQLNVLIIITASHNPYTDNGVKIEAYKKGQQISNLVFQNLKELINSDTEKMKDFIESICINQRQDENENIKSGYNFIARDKRYSSSNLVNQLKRGYQFFGKTPLIDCGQLTTPQFFVIGNNLLKNVQQAYYKKETQIFYNLDSAYVKQFRQKNAKIFIQMLKEVGNNKLKKKKISMDFANGVGAVCYEDYKDVLSQYYDIVSENNVDFAHTNLKCGAQYIGSLEPQELPQMQDYQKKFYFDGDCDRILIQIKDRTNLLHGNYIHAIVAVCLSKLLQKVGLTKYHLVAVHNVNSNYKLIEFLENINIKSQITKVGMGHLAEAAKKYDIATLFQNNGHGSIWVKPSIIQEIRGTKLEHTIYQKLLLAFFQLTQNSSKGYAFHLFFIIQLCQLFLDLQTDQLQLFKAAHEYNDKFKVKNINQFVCCESDHLIKPVKLCQKIQQLKRIYPQCRINIRVSNTENKIRLNVQGEKLRTQLIGKQASRLILSYINE